jgi:hypothetical protein
MSTATAWMPVRKSLLMSQISAAQAVGPAAGLADAEGGAVAEALAVAVAVTVGAGVVAVDVGVGVAVRVGAGVAGAGVDVAATVLEAAGVIGAVAVPAAGIGVTGVLPPQAPATKTATSPTRIQRRACDTRASVSAADKRPRAVR